MLFWLVQRGIVPEPGAQRVLAVITLINRLGSGLFMTSSALFFTRSMAMSVGEVGIGLGTAALVGILAGIPVGHLADLLGARETYAVALAAEGLAMASLMFVRGFAGFVVAICCVELAAAASEATRGPLVREIAGDDPVRFRAYLRAIVNFAVMLGAGLAAVAIQIDTREAFIALIAGNAASFFLAAALVSRLPRITPTRTARQAATWVVLKDRPYIVVNILNAIMSIQYGILLFALPLWVVGHTDAPRWLVGATVVVNTLMVIALQVRASRHIGDPHSAGVTMRRAGTAFLFSTVLIGLSANLPWFAAAILVFAGIVVHSIGEIWHGSAGYELSYSLAAPHAQGEYSGLFTMGTGIANAVAPLVLGLLCIQWGTAGWITIGLILASAGSLFPRVVSWSERTRREEGATGLPDASGNQPEPLPEAP